MLMIPELEKYTRIPSLPTVAVEVLRAFNDPNSSLDQITSIVCKDPAIVGKLLKAANSARFGARGTVTDLKRAVMMMGKNSVTPLVLSFSLSQQAVSSPAHMEQFRLTWLRSFIQATAADVIAGQFGTAAFRGECYTTNLLADIGKLALLRAEPDRYLVCLQRSLSEGASLARIEQDVLGFTHTELSAELLRELGLPDRCIQPIRSINADIQQPGMETERLSLNAVSRTANAVASLICDRTPGVAMMALDSALRDLQLPNPLTAENVLELVQTRLSATASMFDIDPPRLPAPSEMLQEALDQLSQFSVASENVTANAVVPNELLEENGRLKRRVADLLQASRTDVLTGVFNRGWLQTQLAERIALHRIRNQALGLAVIDIDHFKKINDTYGHQAGDQVLRSVAQTLQATLRDSDLLGRYGGEEFVVLMDDCTADGLAIVGERLRSRIESQVIEHEKRRIVVTVSVGLSGSLVVGPDAEFGRLLFAAADTAMYRAKNAGRNRSCIEPFRETDPEFSGGEVSGPGPAKKLTSAR